MTALQRRTRGGGAPKRPISQPDAEPARRAAALLLQAMLDQGRSFDRAWADGGDTFLAGLDDRDRAFVRALCMTVLRRLRQIDRIVDSCLSQPLRPGRSADPARAALRLGAAQILFMEVPDHAAVHASVALLPAASPFRGLVNAVLRRIASEPIAVQGPDDGRAEVANLPDWLLQSWNSRYGSARTDALARASLVEAPLDLTLHPAAKGTAADWAERLQAAVLPTGSLRRTGGGRVAELPGFAEGAWWVQDAAAAVPARILLQALAAGADGATGATTEGRSLPAGCRVLDMCAAPGGKTAQLAAAGAIVTAVERDPLRGARLAENLQRLSLQADLVTADAALWQAGSQGGTEGGFDAVLLDAPCSATGTLRRHPDILHLRRRDDIDTATALQDRLLDAAARHLRPGGVLVYCVCSLQPEEGAGRLAAFLARQEGRLEQIPLQPESFGLPAAAGLEGALQTAPDLWPERGGMDGFYMALLRRRT